MSPADLHFAVLVLYYGAIIVGASWFIGVFGVQVVDRADAWWEQHLERSLRKMPPRIRAMNAPKLR